MAGGIWIEAVVFVAALRALVWSGSEHPARKPTKGTAKRRGNRRRDGGMRWSKPSSFKEKIIVHPSIYLASSRIDQRLNFTSSGVAVGAGARAHGVVRAAREDGTVWRVPFSRKSLAGDQTRGPVRHSAEIPSSDVSWATEAEQA